MTQKLESKMASSDREMRLMNDHIQDLVDVH